jgi:hypothetical protein
LWCVDQSLMNETSGAMSELDTPEESIQNRVIRGSGDASRYKGPTTRARSGGHSVSGRSVGRHAPLERVLMHFSFTRVSCKRGSGELV